MATTRRTTTRTATTTGAATTDPPRAAATRWGLSVRTRITVTVALLAGLALAGAGLVVYALESARIDSRVAAQVNQELGEFRQLQEGNNPRTARPFDDVGELIELFLVNNLPNSDELLLGYWDGAPQKFSDSSYSEILDDPAFRDAVVSRLDSGGSTRLDGTEWGDVVVTVQPVRDGGTRGALVIANFIREEHGELTRVMRTYTIVALLSLGGITALAAWQAGRLLAPVRELRETAENITATDLSRRIPEKSGNDDITALTRTVNDMLERLDQAFTGQRQFLDGAGHELKTPLTILQGHLELLDASSPEEVEATRELLLDEVDRMSRLVNDLITLAKADRPDFFTFAPVAVAPLTETVLDKCSALGPREWRLDETAKSVVIMDEHRVTQALLQLAENAVKHTSEGDEIGIGARLDGQRGVLMWVRDTGRGVRPEDRAVIFERFGRGRVGDADEGFGLGLSIVTAIAHAHGGTVTVEDVLPQGSRFVLALPANRKDGSWHAS